MLTHRLGLFYFTYFAGLGVMLPYFNLYFEHLGMTPIQIGALAAILSLGRVIFPTLWARRADRTGKRRALTLGACALSVLAFAAFLFVDSFAGLALASLALSMVEGPRLPMVEATTVDLSRDGKVDYGRTRSWGSLGFILSALGLGVLLGQQPIRIVIHAALIWAILNGVAALALPAWRVEEGGGGDASLRVFLRQSRVPVFLGACVLMQASHGAYYAFFSIHLEGRGYGSGSIGALWSIGVVAEVVVMILSRRYLARFAPATIMIACACLAAARWGLYSLSAAPEVLIPGQLLHAFSFGAFHLAAVDQTHRLFPRHLHASGQSLFGGLTYGLGTVIGTFGSGILYDALGPWRTFAAEAGVALGAAVALTLFRALPHNQNP